MQIYPITDNTAETIEFKVDDAEYPGSSSIGERGSKRFALVHILKYAKGNLNKTIVVNREEALKLYQALKQEL